MVLHCSSSQRDSCSLDASQFMIYWLFRRGFVMPWSFRFQQHPGKTRLESALSLQWHEIKLRARSLKHTLYDALRGS